jgi:hypothetical protein
MTKAQQVDSRVFAAYLLAGSMWIAAAIGLAPAVIEVIAYLQFLIGDAAHVARWALVVAWLALVESAYALFLVQAPDWGTAAVATLLTLAVAAIYAMGCGIGLVADPAGWLAGTGGLELADTLAGGRAALWSLCLASLHAILAFFAGRLTIQWRRTEAILLRAGR